ncbi:hypothetical protein DSM106972_056570 [Dulcicalothrix desertica PCC 7102]|uniref:AP2/ERF domain-containing protein n=1 Tax=Dulcicalothrix desertica PCC 7102 TaxID=232991 RepID=A0A3S1CFZ3_9CYAN|nr:HNH endonuclease [Dulcicalothrix desertica]RUT02737.1 hypothetical protein DSM106972_056570 [Dulcicalothrix desertica PCC 7102]TWH39028.1 AP2 domain-containing protein [Dulcicalothrix desertica PCC 7102]
MIFSIKVREVLIDNQDTDLLGLTFNGVDSWYVDGRGYLQGWVEGKLIKFHKLVTKRMGFDKTLVVDHINRNPLDNRRINLREATASQNSWNRTKRKNNKSGFKGVHRHSSNKWIARIKVNGKIKHLGTFTDKIAAAIAYDNVAKLYHGEFAVLNFDRE